MNEEKDFFKTCFNTVAGLEVKNESQAIAKEVVLSEIENLQKGIEHLDWVNCHLRKTNEKLKERIAYLERSNNRREGTILEQRQEISDLEDNWNKLEEFIKDSLEAIDTIQKSTGNTIENYTPRILTYNQIKNKMLELEKGGK